MIFVPRPVSPPSTVTLALGKLHRTTKDTELQRARAYYSKSPLPTKSFTFSRYRDEWVCIWLDGLFKSKCAYCESPYSAVSARNIEHYRPKGGIDENPKHTGYWWLASDWRNLLPSCIACNQRRKQAIYVPGITLEELEAARLSPAASDTGKGNAFPMNPPTLWVTTEGADLTTEDPLLIDPQVRDPERHMQWVFDWDRKQYAWEAKSLFAFVKPKQINGVDDPYGKASIATFGLRRVELFRSHREKIVEMQTTASTLFRAMERAVLAKNTHLYDSSLEEVKIQWTNLIAHTETGKRYTSLAKAFISLFEVELRRRSQDLKVQANLQR